MVKDRKLSVKNIPDKHINDKQFVLKLIKDNVFSLPDLPIKYHDDREIMLAGRRLASSFKYASDRLKILGFML